jgi:death-on-curing protein
MPELTAQDFANIHELIEKDFKFREGGGVRDPNTLEAVANRPEQGFYSTVPFPDVFTKAAAIFEGIVCWQPFVDGNKRTALVITRVYLAEHGYSFFIPFGAVRFTVKIAISKPKTQAAINRRLKKIARWIKLHSATSMSLMAEYKYNAYVAGPLMTMGVLSSSRFTRWLTRVITIHWFAFDIYPEYQTEFEKIIVLILQLAADSHRGIKRFTGLARAYRAMLSANLQVREQQRSQE